MTNNYVMAVARADGSGPHRKGAVLGWAPAFFDDTDPKQCEDANRACAAFSEGVAVYRRFPGCTIPVVGEGGGF